MIYKNIIAQSNFDIRHIALILNKLKQFNLCTIYLLNIRTNRCINANGMIGLLYADIVKNDKFNLYIDTSCNAVDDIIEIFQM